MAHRSNYGYVSSTIVESIVSVRGVPGNAYRLLVWSMQYFKKACKLKEYEQEAVHDWAQGRCVDMDTVTTVQFGLRQASSIFNGSTSLAGRQVEKLCQLGLLEKVGTAKKGHAQLFVVCPDCYTSKECNKKPSDKYTSDSGLVHLPSRIVTPADAVSGKDAAYPKSNPINYPVSDGLAPSEGTGEPPLCPQCGSSVEPIAAGWLCPQCMNVFK